MRRLPLAVFVVVPLLVAFGLFRWVAAPHREKATRIHCAGNLKQIGLALRMYAHDNNGAFPETLYPLVKLGYLDNPGTFFCPETKTRPPKQFRGKASFKSDYHYAYRPDMTPTSPESETCVVVLDHAGNHSCYGNILYADGHVKGHTGYEWYRAGGFDRVPMPSPPQR